jgi:hypothetical protein
MEHFERPKDIEMEQFERPKDIESPHLLQQIISYIR